VDDLLQFLRDRLNETEARVRALPAGPWRWTKWDDPESEGLTGPNGAVLTSEDAEGYKSWITRDEAFDAYLQDIQPARILAEIQAKRALVDEFERCGPNTQGHSGLRFAVQVHAAVYADHPDFRDEWRP
jgi:hypothetical protein